MPHPSKFELKWLELRASGGSRSGPKRVKVPPWRSLGGSLAAFGRIWHAFGVHFEVLFWFNLHHFSGRPKTLILNDLTVLFDVFVLLKALLLGSFLGSFSVPISDPLQNRLFACINGVSAPTFAFLEGSPSFLPVLRHYSEKSSTCSLAWRMALAKELRFHYGPKQRQACTST